MGLFFQEFWSIIAKDAIQAVQYFFQYFFMPDDWKKMYIALIPKLSNHQKVKDYQPIILCNTIYKLIVKILANRLQSILPRLVLWSKKLLLNVVILQKIFL